MSTYTTQIRFRQGTAAQWLQVNPVLTEGEPGYETDTNKFKIGDGESTWSELNYQGQTGVAGITELIVNGTPVTITDGSASITIPTNTSDLNNNSDFTTATAVSNNYYNKTEINTKLQNVVCDADFSIDPSTFIITLQLKDSSGNNIGNAKTIDLPLESVVVNGSYDNETKLLTLTLQNGNTIEVGLSDIINGLQATLTAGTNIDITNNVISSTGADPVLTGASDPTTSTAGKVNQLYRNTTNNSLFICTEVIEIPGDLLLEEPSTYTYTWSAITSGGSSVVTNDSKINVNDKVENIYLNTHISESEVNTFLAGLPYNEEIDIPGDAVGSPDDIIIPNTITHLITCSFIRGQDNNFFNKPLICATNLQALGNALNTMFGADTLGGSGYALVALYGNQLIYLSEDTAANRKIGDMFGMNVKHAGWQDITYFNIYNLFLQNYNITPDYSNTNYYVQVTSKNSNYASFTDRLAAKIPFTYYEPQNIYRCAYNETSYINIQKALTNNQLPICIYNNEVYIYDSSTVSSITLARVTESVKKKLTVTADSTHNTLAPLTVWSAETISLNVVKQDTTATSIATLHSALNTIKTNGYQILSVEFTANTNVEVTGYIAQYDTSNSTFSYTTQAYNIFTSGYKYKVPVNIESTYDQFIFYNSDLETDISIKIAALNAYAEFNKISADSTTMTIKSFSDQITSAINSSITSYTINYI